MVNIRDAIYKDAEFIIHFQFLMAFETERISLDKITVGKGVFAVLEDKNKGSYIVAESDGKIVASLLLTSEWSDWRNGKILWVQSVYVLPEYRGRGVFRQMYGFVKNRTDSDGKIKGIRLYVDKSNIVAQKVYKSLGMNGDHYTVYEMMKY